MTASSSRARRAARTRTARPHISGMGRVTVTASLNQTPRATCCLNWRKINGAHSSEKRVTCHALQRINAHAQLPSRRLGITPYQRARAASARNISTSAHVRLFIVGILPTERDLAQKEEEG